MPVGEGSNQNIQRNFHSIQSFDRIPTCLASTFPAEHRALPSTLKSATMETIQYSLIDTHVHIDELRDLGVLVQRARSEGVRAIIGVGSDFVSNEKVLRIARAFPD